MQVTSQAMNQFAQSRVTVFVGAFGSGKTELALNLAIRLAHAAGDTPGGAGHDAGGSAPRVRLADIDILKPMFRSRELAARLAAEGVRVVSSAPEYESADVPALSPEIYGAIEDVCMPLVVDVGGDDDGARALGRFRSHLERAGYDMLYVVNTLRPFSSSPEEIITMLRAIENTSRLSCTALVSNTNLGAASTAEEARTGLDIVGRVSDEVGIPVRFFAVSRSVAQSDYESVRRVAHDYCIPAFIIDRLVLPPWERL